MEDRLQLTVDCGGKSYSGNCYIRGAALVFDIQGLGQWATEAALADYKLGEAARILAELLLPHMIMGRIGSDDEPIINVQKENMEQQEVEQEVEMALQGAA